MLTENKIEDGRIYEVEGLRLKFQRFDFTLTEALNN